MSISLIFLYEKKILKETPLSTGLMKTCVMNCLTSLAYFSHKNQQPTNNRRTEH